MVSSTIGPQILLKYAMVCSLAISINLIDIDDDDVDTSLIELEDNVPLVFDNEDEVVDDDEPLLPSEFDVMDDSDEDDDDPLSCSINACVKFIN
jgi:hypothetical protein